MGCGSGATTSWDARPAVENQHRSAMPTDRTQSVRRWWLQE